MTLTTGTWLMVGGLVAALVFWPSDFFFFADWPETRHHFAWVRAGVSAACVATLAVLRLAPRFAERWVTVILGAQMSGTAVWIGYQLGQNGGFETPWFYTVYPLSPLTLVLMTSLPVRILLTVVSAGCWTGSYLVSAAVPVDRVTLAILNFRAFVVVFCIAWGHAGYLLLGRSWLQRRRLQEQQSALEAARGRSEALLLNILPGAVAERLKAQERPIADAFPDVSVLFADIAGFTALSVQLSPAELVILLNRIFTEFDTLADGLGLEKIKTIGDAYMVAAGLPTPRVDHAHAIAEMALRMREVLDRLAQQEGQRIRMRIGVHSGPVVAGVIGVKKFAYDLWGDTVNTASRMEAHADDGTIQVTRQVYERIRDRFVLTANAPMDVKGKGKMETWRLEGRAPAA